MLGIKRNLTEETRVGSVYINEKLDLHKDHNGLYYLCKHDTDIIVMCCTKECYDILFLTLV